jgi:CRP/FNR family nitrogen fixation transcriptional regulator
MASRNPWTTTVQGEKCEWNHNAATVGSPVHFNQDSEIYGEGDDAEVFFKVVSGIIRTCKFLASGRRQIDAFFVSGDLL